LFLHPLVVLVVDHDGFDGQRARLGRSEFGRRGLLEFLAKGYLDGLFVESVGSQDGGIELASHGVVVGTVVAQEGFDGCHNVKDQSVGVANLASHGIVVGAVVAEKSTGVGGGHEGNLGVTQIVVGTPVNVIVGGHKSLGQNSLFALVDLLVSGDTLEDDGGVEGGNLLVRYLDVLVRFDGLVVGIETNRTGLGGGQVCRSLCGLDTVAKVDLEFGRGILLAETGTVVGDGGHEHRVGRSTHGIVVGAVVAQESDGGLDGKDVGAEGSYRSSHRIIVGAVVAQKAIGTLEIDRVRTGHVVADLPVDVVVGSHQSLADEFEVFSGRSSLGTLEDDFTVEETVVIDDLTGRGGLLLRSKVEGGGLDGGDGKRESCDRELHGRK